MVDNEFLEQFEKYRHEFYAFAQRNVWNTSLAEDVLSAATVSAYEKRHNFRAGSNFRAWIYKFLVNKCFTANKQYEHTRLDVEQIEAEIEPETITVNILQDPNGFMEHCDDKVVTALGHLRSEERTCFLLLSLGGYSYKEIAGITDMPRATVMTHLARGRVKLRRSLVHYAQENGYVPLSDSDTTRTRGGML
jgi:RNA polymerase sigma-70 factor, ECF subfamily